MGLIFIPFRKFAYASSGIKNPMSKNKNPNKSIGRDHLTSIGRLGENLYYVLNLFDNQIKNPMSKTGIKNPIPMSKNKNQNKSIERDHLTSIGNLGENLYVLNLFDNQLAGHIP